MSVPECIDRFMKKEGIAFLVRGKPGTGKTTFALTLMKDYNFAYVTTKKNRERIVQEYPWLTEEMVDKIFAIEEKYIYKETDRFGESFYLLPESLRHVLNLFEDSKIEGLVIDSWHSVINQLNIKAIEEKEREKIYDANTFFLKLAKFANMGVKITVVREGEEDDSLTYISDGVLTFKQHVREGRIYRWFEVDKLRGVEVQRRTHYFTLKDSIFTCVSSAPLKHPSAVNGLKSNEGITTLYFDDMFSLKRGNTVLYDFGEFIPKSYKTTAIMGMVASFLTSGSKVLMIPPNELDMSELKYGIYLFGLEKSYENLTYIYGEKTMEHFSKKINLSKPQEIVMSIKDELGYTSSPTPPLVIVGYDRLSTYLNDKEMMHTLFRIKDVVREKSGILLIAGTVYDKEVKRFVSSISDIYAKFSNVDGYVIAYGIKPWTNAYALTLAYDRYPKIVKRVIV